MPQQPPTAAIEDTVRAELDRPGAAHFTRNEIRTVLAELDQARARLAAVLALLPADPAEDINASWVPLRKIRAAATGSVTKEA